MFFNYYETPQEYTREYKRSCWDTAIGLQAVDGLEVSEYLKELSEKEIEGVLSSYEIEELLYKKYETEEEHEHRIKEADIVAARISRLLQEPGFSFSPITLKYIHKTLFTDIYDFAGEYRNYNISKNEPILGGRTVKYTNFQMIVDTLQYDFEQQKKIAFSSMKPEDVVKKVAEFTSSVWQVHPFGEGNTRTTAVFIQKYLNHMGFQIDNSPFADNALFFRNALVRANYANYSDGVFPEPIYLERFYEVLLFNKEHALKNRDMFIEQYLKEAKQLVQKNPKI